MNDAAERLEWLDRLQSGGGDPAPLVGYTTAERSIDREKAWEEGRDLGDFWALSDLLSDRAGRPGPLVLVTDENDDPSGRVVVAVKTARLLAESGRRVLLVDADFRREGLARVLDGGDTEGLADIFLYGASPRAACRPSGTSGIDVLGVGSFRPPAEENAFEDDAVRRGLAMLRSAYDVVFLLAPAFTASANFNPLLVHADGVVLCTDVRSVAEDRVEAFLKYLQGQVVPLWGVLAFSTAGETAERLVDDQLWESQTIDQPRVRRVAREESRSSPVFRRLTLGLAVVLVGFLGWWGWTQFGRGAFDPFSRIPARPAPSGRSQASQTATQPAAEPAPEVAGDVVTGTTPPPPDAAASTAAEVPVAAALDADSGTDADVEVDEDAAPQPAKKVARQEPPATGDLTRPSRAPATASVDEAFDEADAGARETPPKETVATPPPRDEPPESTSPDGFDPALVAATRLSPDHGYALHLWSFPDSLEAVLSSRVLVRDGYAPRIVATSIPARGTWYRVLVGSFKNRRDALAAREILGARPDVEYVGVVSVP